MKRLVYDADRDDAELLASKLGPEKGEDLYEFYASLMVDEWRETRKERSQFTTPKLYPRSGLSISPRRLYEAYMNRGLPSS